MWSLALLRLLLDLISSTLPINSPRSSFLYETLMFPSSSFVFLENVSVVVLAGNWIDHTDRRLVIISVKWSIDACDGFAGFDGRCCCLVNSDVRDLIINFVIETPQDLNFFFFIFPVLFWCRIVWILFFPNFNGSSYTMLLDQQQNVFKVHSVHQNTIYIAVSSGLWRIFADLGCLNGVFIIVDCSWRHRMVERKGESCSFGRLLSDNGKLQGR